MTYFDAYDKYLALSDDELLDGIWDVVGDVMQLEDLVGDVMRLDDRIGVARREN